MFYSGEDMRGSEGILAYNPPQLIAATLNRVGTGAPPVRISDPLPAGMLSNYNPATVSLKSRDRDQNSATVYQWNTAMQFLLPWDSTFELAYVGNQSRNLLAIYSANQVPFGKDGSVAANRPFPEWQQIGHAVTQAQSSYNALQVKFEKRMSRGFYALTSYTFASALDEYGAWGASSDVQIGDNFRLERGPQAQVSRQRLTYSQVWRLPFGRGRALAGDMPALAEAIFGGWQISGIATMRSGLPVNVTLASSGVDPRTGLNYTFLNRNGGALRPNRVGEPNTSSDARADRFHYLDAAAYQVQPVNTPGNAARNSAWGPGFFTTDLSFVKRFDIDEQKGIDFRLEMFNAFNRTNYNNPSGSFGSSGFGIISDAYDPRIMQAAVRFFF